MTSRFAQYRRLSQQTLDAYHSYGALPRSVQDRLDFYLLFLQDVAPAGVTVEHVPVDISDNEGRVSAEPSAREQILLTISGTQMIFMSGLVSMEYNRALERTAADEAYTQWLYGDFVPDGYNWRFFTCQTMILFYHSHRSDRWDSVGDFNPFLHADQVATFLQQEYDRAMTHHYP